MAKPRIEPHKIKSPIQLLAAWFAALVLIDGALLTAAVKIASPGWLPPTLVIAAIVFVPVFLGSAILMQTKFRPQLQEDSFYAAWLERRELLFNDFSAENAPLLDVPAQAPVTTETWNQREERRIMRYQVQEGLFLVHAWRPSQKRGQVADIVIWLHQHKSGPLNRGEVERVEYHLGPLFFTEPVVKTNSGEAFKLEVSAYYPMLCLACVFVRNKSEPVELERYIDFEVPSGGAHASVSHLVRPALPAPEGAANPAIDHDA